LRLRIPDQYKQVAADAARGRLHQAQDRVDGDGRIYGVAAASENVQADLRR
jgi:hypothetical protein